MVGFDDEARRITDHLLGGSRQLDIVSIVGMPGLGKTALAKKVYDDPSITFHFTFVHGVLFLKSIAEKICFLRFCYVLLLSFTVTF